MASVGETLRCKKCGQYAPDRCTCREWQSNAQWPLDVYRGADGKGISTDKHRTKEGAQIVCDMLRGDGFGGEGKAFPIKTWVS